MRLCAFFALLLALGGCSIYKYELGGPLSKSDLTGLEADTPLSEVLDRLGPPQRMSSTPEGFIMAWEYWFIEERRVGLSLGAAGADFLSADWGDANARGLFLIANFDADNTLMGTAVKEWDNNLGGGRGVQPLFGFVSVVDVEDLTRNLPVHRWGQTSLGRLPATLNAQSAPETGDNGIEQRGTPRRVGQHTLELR